MEYSLLSYIGEVIVTYFKHL